MQCTPLGDMSAVRSSGRLGWLSVSVLMSLGSQAQNIPVPPLPYDYSALVPFIGEHALKVSNAISAE